MAIMASSTSLHFYTSKSNPSFPSSLKKPQLQQGRSILLKAADPEAETQAATAESETERPVAASTSQQQQPDNADSFEKRLSQVRLKYKSGTGKKAEVRKSKKSSAGSKAKGSSSGGGVFLPPVPLKEAVSGGVKVDFGFSPYTERLNGRLAGLGLSALLLVELASGKSVLRYHGPAILFLQVYFVAAVSAVFVKYEKERISVWPQN